MKTSTSLQIPDKKVHGDGRSADVLLGSLPGSSMCVSPSPNNSFPLTLWVKNLSLREGRDLLVRPELAAVPCVSSVDPCSCSYHRVSMEQHGSWKEGASLWNPPHSCGTFSFSTWPQMLFWCMAA